MKRNNTKTAKAAHIARANAHDREALIRAASNVAAMIARMANDTGDYANAVRRDNYRSAALLAISQKPPKPPNLQNKCCFL